MSAGLNGQEPPDTGTGWRHLIHEARVALTVTLLLALLAGVLFPALVLGIGQVAFPAQADGSLLRNADRQVIGSKLIGQRFSGPEYFHGRPSAAGADGYDAANSSGLNLGPTNEKFAETLRERARAYRKENSLTDDVDLPADAVTTSASGLDPHISAANAYLQAARVAATRGLPEAVVRDLVRDHVDGRVLGFFGEPRVNVLRLNLALDEADQ
ncbi:MAG TPA: K(+)-transporting ATPase subunit C [Dehalococcoidia bacterium]|jgi:K+-transporting ATPase ATPase C chain